MADRSQRSNSLESDEEDQLPVEASVSNSKIFNGKIECVCTCIWGYLLLFKLQKFKQ